MNLEKIFSIDFFCCKLHSLYVYWIYRPLCWPKFLGRCTPNACTSRRNYEQNIPNHRWIGRETSLQHQVHHKLSGRLGFNRGDSLFSTIWSPQNPLYLGSNRARYVLSSQNRHASHSARKRRNMSWVALEYERRRDYCFSISVLTECGAENILYYLTMLQTERTWKKFWLV